MAKNLLFYLINFPLLCIFIIFFLGLFQASANKKIYNSALYLSAFSFISSLILLLYLNKSNLFFQAIFQISLSPLTTDG
jgi:hypothetical protein